MEKSSLMYKLELYSQNNRLKINILLFSVVFLILFIDDIYKNGFNLNTLIMYLIIISIMWFIFHNIWDRFFSSARRKLYGIPEKSRIQKKKKWGLNDIAQIKKK